jgi:hypothetical protein
MRFAVLLALGIAARLGAQESLRTYTYDVNGARIAGPAMDVRHYDGVTETTERMQSINGRSAPLERVVERVIREDSQGKVVERRVVRYDREGRPAQVEKVLIEESKRADGGSTVRTTTYREDVNGNAYVAERFVADASPSPTGSNTEIVVERPSINGELQTAERRSVSVEKNGPVENQRTVVYRRDGNGRFYEALRTVRESTQQDGGAVENITVYERFDGAMQVSEQKRRRIEKSADGSQSELVDIFRLAAPGAALDASAAPRLIERQVIERRPTAGGYVETMSVQRPSLADPARLGPPHQIAETVCQGKCEETSAAHP